MTIHRARIIIGILAVVISIFGALVCIHYTIQVKGEYHANTTSAPEFDYLLSNTTSNVTVGWNWIHFSHGQSYTALPFMPGPNYTQDLDLAVENHSSILLTSWQAATTTKKVTGIVTTLCDVNMELIDKRFYGAFQSIYSGIFLVCCVIVLVLYSLIYR